MTPPPTDHVKTRTPSGRRVPLMLWVVSLAAFVGAFALARGFSSSAIFLLSVALAAAVNGAAHWMGWKSTGWWASLTIVGFAATLQLVDAGRGVRYQHFNPWDIDSEIRLVALLVVAAQTAITAAFWCPRLGALRGAVIHRVRWWQMVLFAGFVIMTSAVPSMDLPAYAAELLATALVQLVALASVAATTVSLPIDTQQRLTAWSRSWLGNGGGQDRTTPRVDMWVVSAAVWVATVCAVLAVTVYQRHPHVPDEISYLFQARYFAEGVLWMPVPPVPAAFDVDLMIYEPTRWFSPFPPGWPAILAGGTRLGAPWLVNPVLAGINVVLAYLIVWALYDRKTARLTLIFLASSPWYLFLGMSFMAHMATMTAGLVAALAVWKLRGGKPLVWAIVGGAALALVGTIRPLEGLVVAVLLGFWGLGGREKSRWRRLGSVSVLAVSAMAFGSIGLWYNTTLTGGPLLFPVTTYFDSVYGVGTNALGFGADQGVGWPIDAFPGHSPFEAVVNIGLNLPLVNVELLGWPTGSMMVLGGLIIWGCFRRADYWLVAVIAAIVVAHGAYWFAGGPDFGARYWYMILLPAMILSARGVLSLCTWVGEEQGREFDIRPLGASLVLVALSLVVFMPWRSSDRYYHYRGMRPDIRELADRHGFGRSLVLVRGPRAPDYASAAVYNPLDLTASEPIYAWDRDLETRRALVEVYGDRPVWIVDGPTRSGAGYRVVAGPLAPTGSAKSSGVQ